MWFHFKIQWNIILRTYYTLKIFYTSLVKSFNFEKSYLFSTSSKGCPTRHALY